MGVSTDAYLVYGIPLEEEDSYNLWLDGARFDTRYLDEEDIYYCLINNIDVGFLFEVFSYNELYEKIKEFKKQNCISPFCIETHCSDNYPMHIIHVPDHLHSASRGYPEKIENLEVDKEKEQAFLDFVKKYAPELDTKQLGWYLCSYWG